MDKNNKTQVGVLWINRKDENSKPYLTGEINGVKVKGWYTDTKLTYDEAGKPVIDPITGQRKTEPLMRWDTKLERSVPCACFKIVPDDTEEYKLRSASKTTTSTATKFTQTNKDKGNKTEF